MLFCFLPSLFYLIPRRSLMRPLPLRERATLQRTTSSLGWFVPRSNSTDEETTPHPSASRRCSASPRGCHPLPQGERVHRLLGVGWAKRGVPTAFIIRMVGTSLRALVTLRMQLHRRKERQRRAFGWFEHHLHRLADLQTIDVAIDDI